MLARDIDAGVNKDVRYRIVSNSKTQRGEYFSIDEEKGDITTNVDSDLLDFENFTSVQLTIQAYDLGKPSQTNLQTITISLIDMNDQKPYFEKDIYTYVCSLTKCVLHLNSKEIEK